MARTRPVGQVAPEVLTLEDWEQVLAEGQEGKESDVPWTTKADAAPCTDVAETLQPLSGRERVTPTTRHRPHAAELLETPGALLTRTDLRKLGLERRAVDAVFRALPVVALPGYSRPMVRAEKYRALVKRFTYCDDRVRPIDRRASDQLQDLRG